MKTTDNTRSDIAPTNFAKLHSSSSLTLTDDWSTRVKHSDRQFAAAQLDRTARRLDSMSADLNVMRACIVAFLVILAWHMSPIAPLSCLEFTSFLE